MSDAVDHGITVTEIASMDQPIDVCPETTAAFVGRALRGPVNTPVLVQNLGEFRRRFGAIWPRSSLGPAVEQFFEHGGKRLYVVRVSNGAKGAMLCLPASGSALIMRAVDPGSTEFIRAAVDYDGSEDVDLFNLTLQRIDPATGLVTDQEFFRKCSWREDAEKFIADELLSSTLARVERPFPLRRPERTRATGATSASIYVDHSQAGTDGSALSNYDLIGSRRERSGLFALEKIERFDTLYLPPPTKNIDTGPVAIMAAELYCRKRQAMLIVDPVAHWQSAEEAISGMRDLGYRSPNLLGYFPRMAIRGDDDTVRPAGGALAGLLCKQDRTYGPWQSLDQSGMGLQRKLIPQVPLQVDDVARLARAGLNAIVKGPAGRSRIHGSVTMGCGAETDRLYSFLTVRRFCLSIVNTIARATRWAVFESPDADLASRVRGQLLTYFSCLNDLGAFANEDWEVRCEVGSGGYRTRGIDLDLYLSFTVAGCDEAIAFSMHQTPSTCRVSSTVFGLTEP